MAQSDDAWSPGEQPLGRTLLVLRERWLVIIAAGLIAAVSAYLAASSATKEYKATATLLFRSSQLGEAIGGTQVFSSSLDPNRDLATDLALVKSKQVAAAVKQSLHSSLTVDQLLNKIDVTAASGADIGNVTATSTDPKHAAEYANAFAAAYVVNRRQADRDVVAQAEALVRARLRTATTDDDRQALRAALTKLTTLEAVQTGSAEVSNVAGVPTTPSSPHPKRDAFIALLLGLAGGFGLSYAISVLDRHVKTAEGLERLYGLPLLATIPQRAFTARARESHDRLEPFRILHSSIEMMLARDEAYVLLVTSALAMEGKSTVSANLGRVIAQSGHRVAVVEADLRRPTMIEHFDIGTGATGLSTALTTDRPLTELLRPVDDLGRRLMILPSGPALAKPTEALRTQRMQSIVKELQRNNAVVIIDAPPLLAVADSHILLDRLNPDGVLVVARANHLEQTQIHRVRGMLESRQVDHVGLVVTGTKNSRLDQESYYYTARPSRGREVVQLDASSKR